MELLRQQAAAAALEVPKTYLLATKLFAVLLHPFEHVYIYGVPSILIALLLAPNLFALSLHPSEHLYIWRCHPPPEKYENYKTIEICNE